MSSFQRTDIRWPADSGAFERACAALFGDWLNDPAPQRIGTSGAEQDGVDILCLRDGDPRRPVGVQCKLRLGRGTLTPKMVEVEIEKALGFSPALTEYYIVTTLPNITRVQQRAAEVAKAQAETGRAIRIQVWGADTLTDHIDQSAVAKAAFDPGASPALDRQEIILREVRSGQDALSETNAAIVAELRRTSSSPPLIPAGLIDRELRHTLALTLRRRGFLKVDLAGDLARLADRAISGDLGGASAPLRAEACERASRAFPFTDVERARAFRRAAAEIDPAYDLAIADALIREADGDPAGALRDLSERSDVLGRTEHLRAVARRMSHADFLSWLDDEGIRLPELSPIATLVAINAALEAGRFDAALAITRTAPSGHCEELPVLIMLQAQLEVAQLAPPIQRPSLLQTLPLNPNAIQLADGAAAQATLVEAVNELTGLLDILRELGLTVHEQTVLEYVLWLRLRNPQTRRAAKAQLEEELSDKATGFRRVRLALAYDVSFDRAALARRLKRLKDLGGWGPEERTAAFALAFSSPTPLELSDFIAEHRPDLYAAPEFENAALVECEVEALARAGRVGAAKQTIADHLGRELGAEQARELTELVDSIDGGSELETMRLRFEASHDLFDLLALVRICAHANDTLSLAAYAPLLARQTKMRRDFEMALDALLQIHDYDGALALIDDLPDLVALDLQFLSAKGFALCRIGRVMEAAPIAREMLASRGDATDRELAIEVAIETGDWSFLQSLIDQAKTRIETLEAKDLIRFARLAFEVGNTSVAVFRDAALERAPDDPNINLQAHMLAIEAGDERLGSKAGEWLRKAIETSGADGPIRMVTLGEVVEHAGGRNERAHDLDRSLRYSEVPNFLAVESAGGQFIDLHLGQALRNADDAIEHPPIAILAFSEEHRPARLDANQIIALDVSAILTLSYLGRLDEVISAFAGVVVSPQTLTLLFTERQFLRVQQPFLTARAKRLQAMIALGRLKLAPDRPDAPMVKEIGSELASLLALASENDGVVVRPPPILKVGSLMEEHVDVGAVAHLLTDAHAVVSLLRAKGRLDTAKARDAERYLAQVDPGWPSGAAIDPTRPLYLDSLTLHYLHYLDLLDPLAAVVPDLFVHSCAVEEIEATIRGERQSEALLSAIERLRASLNAGLTSGKVRFSRRRPPADEEDRVGRHRPLPTPDLLLDLSGVDVVVIDDRCLGRMAEAADEKQRSRPIAHTLDVLEMLDGHCEKLWDERHRLREAGFFAVPLTRDELVHRISSAAVDNGRVQPSRELRAIRDSIELPLVRQIPIAPGAVWFNDLRFAILRAIGDVWETAEDPQTARARSEWLLFTLPEPHFWRFSDDDDAAFAISRQIAAAQVALLFTLPLGHGHFRNGYNAWLEDIYIPHLKHHDAGFWDEIILKTKDFISHSIDNNEPDAGES